MLPPAPAPAPRTTATPAAAADGTSPDMRASTGPPPRRRSAWLPLLVAIAVAAVVAVIALAVTMGGDGSPDAPAAQDSSTSGEPTEESSSPDEPDAEAMDSFIRDYLDTAARNPERAFAMLTPAFQAASGGLDGYVNGFWGNVRRIEAVSGVQADPEALTIDYTYRYTLRNGTTTPRTSASSWSTPTGSTSSRGQPEGRPTTR